MILTLSSLARPLLFALAAASLFIPGLAAIVTDSADNGPGSLRQAILDAAPGDEITFAPALDGQTIVLEGTQLTINKDLTINASGLKHGLTISGNDSSRVLEIGATASVAISSLTITRGNSGSESGGGILINGGLVLQNSTITQNQSGSFGGGILNAGEMNLINSTITENSGASGGGLWMGNSSQSAIYHATISNNFGNPKNMGTVAGLAQITNSIIAEIDEASGTAANMSGLDSNSFRGVNLISGGIPPGPNILVSAPLLDTLGNNGGPTQTMRLLPGSPAIDAGLADGLSIDQREATRPIDANGDGTATPDIGAYESPLFVFVTNTDDAGPGSLRDTISGAPPNTAIFFDPSLAGQTITLDGTPLLIDKSLGIDASFLPDGITISGNDSSQIFQITGSGSIVNMRGLTIRDGRASGPSPQGGGIFNDGGALTLIECTLTNNRSSSFGGALYNESESLLETIATTISANRGFSGGGIRNEGKAVLINSTLAGNVGRSTNNTAGSGGAINNTGTLELIHCTLSQNTAAVSGGGIHNANGAGAQIGNVNLTDTIVAGNSATADPDVSDLNGRVTLSGNNFIGGNPGLAPLGAYGGRTETMPPQSGSPVIDAAISSTLNLDQRGFSRGLDGTGDGVGTPDIGAGEFNDNIWVTTLSDAAFPGSLRHVIANLAPGGEIAFAPALDGQTITMVGTHLQLEKDLTIDASALPHGIKISGNNASRVFVIPEGATASLKGLTIADGKAPDGASGIVGINATFSSPGGGPGGPGEPGSHGGGILNHGSLTLLQVILTDNTAGKGGKGGNGGSGEFSIPGGGTFSGPQGQPGAGALGGNGGGLFNSGTGSVIIDLCTVSNNASGSGSSGGVGAGIPVAADGGDGGGIANAGELTLTRTTISQNITGEPGIGGVPALPGSGGGIQNSGSLNLAESILVSNTGGHGGAVWSSGDAIIEQCTITANAANSPNSGKGGGVHTSGGTLLVDQITLTNNSSTESGGGIYATLQSESTTINNSIIASNTASSLPNNIWADNGFIIELSGVNLFPIGVANPPLNGTPPLFGAPLLAPLGDYGGPTQTMPPLRGSPAIDAAIPRPEITTDQRGFPRPIDGDNDGSALPDLGAVELFNIVVNTLADSGPGSLRDTIADALPGSSIFFDPSLNGQTITLDGTHLTIDKDLKLDGSDLSEGIILSAAGNSRVLVINAGVTVTLEGLTITEGKAPDGTIGTAGATSTSGGPGGNGGPGGTGAHGGGIFNSGTLILHQVALIANTAGKGGAGGQGGFGFPRGNGGPGGAGGSGGALYNSETATVSITNSTITNNLGGTAGRGGSGRATGAAGTGGSGGALYNAAIGTISISKSTITDNRGGSGGRNSGSGSRGGTGGSGGGLYNAATATAFISNSTIFKNHGGAGGDAEIPGLGGTGGGIRNLGTLTAIHSNIVENKAGESRPGFVPTTRNTGGGIQTSGSLTLRNSIVALNAGSPQPNLEGSITAEIGFNLIDEDPLLSPLGNYGGPTQTMYLLPGSPAIDAGGATDLTTDQRGRPRVADGDGNGVSIPDIGAYELGDIIVTSVANNGPGSLRDIVKKNVAYERIRFNTDPADGYAFDGGPSSTIVLNSPLLLTGAGTLDFDASDIPGGVTLSGNDASQILFIGLDAIVEIDSMTFTKGSGADAGAIANEGSLTLSNSTISDSTSFFGGGGIFNFGGTLMLKNSTLSGNAATNGSGGGIANNDGMVTCRNSTISGNSATVGGGIENSGGDVTLHSSTLSGNLATNRGGGINNNDTLNITNSIVAGNTASTAPNVRGSITSGSHNIIDDDPRLAPLGDYGGPTQTMPLLVGSPAIDAGLSVGAPATDQRGFSRIVGTPDIGALESGPTILVSNVNDSGAGSLRAAIDAASDPGSRILFDLPSSNNQIQLSGTELTIESGRSVFLDASSLVDGTGEIRREPHPVRPGDFTPRGVSVFGHTTARVFKIEEGGNAAMQGLTISNGNATTGNGGGILNQGVLTLNDTTVSDNDATQGGGIASSGRSLTLNHSTINSNRASGSGGGLHTTSDGVLRINSSTIVNNRANGSGGGLSLDQSLPTTIRNSTIAFNRAIGEGNGGGIRMSSGLLNLSTSIVANNIAGNASPDLDAGDGIVLPTGVNLIHQLDGSGLTEGPNLINQDPLLAPLADNGGPTMTMALLGNSPAIDADTDVQFFPFADQRGFPRLLAEGLDIGAFESGAGNFNVSGLTLYAKVPEALGSVETLRFEISTSRDFLAEVTTEAGTGTFGKTNDTADTSEFGFPSDLVQDSEGNLFIADSGNHMIRMIDQDGMVSTIAGTGSFGLANGDGDRAKFAFPSSLALDSEGDLYVSDTINHVIRKLTRPEVEGLPWKVTTVAGFGFPGFLDGIGSNSLFNHPHGITLDDSDNIYVADTDNNRIRKITPERVVTTWAGTGEEGNLDGNRLSAKFASPFGVVADSMGNLFVADTGNHRIRQIHLSENVTTIAGSIEGSQDGPGSDPEMPEDSGIATFELPTGITLDMEGNLIIADEGNHAIRRLIKPLIKPIGQRDPWEVKTIAGTGDAGFEDGAGSKVGATFNSPTGVLVTTNGNILVADGENHRIRRIRDPLFVDAQMYTEDFSGVQLNAVLDTKELELEAGTPYYFRWIGNGETQIIIGQNFTIVAIPSVVTTPASSVTRTTAIPNGTVNPNGTATQISFEYSTEPDLGKPWSVQTPVTGLTDPEGLAVDADGNVYLADRDAHQILLIEPSGTISVFAGSGVAGFADGNGEAAQFDHPVDIAIDAAGNLYVADELNHRIRKITSLGVVSTIAGSGDAGFIDHSDATSGRFLFPCGVAVNAAGDQVYVADRGNQRIRLITGGALSTHAGDGTAAFADGLASSAQFNNPTAVAVDADGNVFVADRDNHRIRLITNSGQVSTKAGLETNGYLDGSGAQAQFSFPSGIAIDDDGTLYVSDTGNHRIRSIDRFNLVRTVAGSGIEERVDSPSSDFFYPATAAAFSSPNHITVTADGSKIFLTEQGGQGIREIARNPLPTLVLPQNFIGDESINVGALIPETLLLGTTYYYRILGSSSQGEAVGEILSFTTFLNQAIAVFAGQGAGQISLSNAQSGAIAFDTTPRGTSITLPFTITNVGEWDLEVASLNSPAGFTVTGGTGIIAPGASLTFEVTLIATSGGSFEGDLKILSNDPELSRFTFPISGLVLNPPTVITGDASDLANHSATLNAAINPEDSDTTVWVEYSEDPELDGVLVTTMSGPSEGHSSGVSIDQPNGIAIDGAGNLYLADTQNHRICRIAPDGTSIIIAGTGEAGFANGPADSAQFNEPIGIAVHSDGTIFVTDSLNHRIRAISPTGEVSTHSGLGLAGFTNGNKIAARYNLPWGLAIDGNGILYVADRANNRIRKVAADGEASTLTGTGSAGDLNGTIDLAEVNQPIGIAVTNTGLVYITELGNHAIRRVESNGTVSTLAGGASPGFLDALGTTARFSRPTGLAIDSDSQLLVADRENHRIRKVTADGAVTTLAGFGMAGFTNGTGEVARFDNPESLAVGPEGDIFVGEITHATIRHIGLASVVVEVATGLTGISDLPVSLPLDDLKSGTRYYFRAFATSAGGTSFGQIESFLLPSPTSFQTWQITNFGTDADEPLIAGERANPSADGIANLLKYAFLLDPNLKSPNGLPKATLEGPNLTITYTRVNAATDLGYTVEWSNDLFIWSLAGITETVITDDGITSLVQAAIPIGTESKKFLRVGITLQAP